MKEEIAELVYRYLNVRKLLVLYSCYFILSRNGIVFWMDLVSGLD